MDESGALSTTVLHSWHVANGGKMVEFGGWEMPVQYSTGIIGEHVATRRSAGLFDVSHMGRYRITGPNACAFLMHTLTNDARKLSPGIAHYSFISNDHGGAIDDVFLYQLAPEDYLLVVNAGNRDKDWNWLTSHNASRGPHAATLEDHSEAQAMLALQGPASETILRAALGADALPCSKRNRIKQIPHGDGAIIVTRTGYTGEPTCFELFCPSEHAVDLWTQLVAAGATPAGLGARDSLRLEADLPLYGHELGSDKNGDDIPILANTFAKFAVKLDTEREFIGRAALARQRATLDRTIAGDLTDNAALPQLIKPVRVTNGRRPLRAGYRVEYEGREVGTITSGLTVPRPDIYRATGTLPKASEMRPIGLALMDAALAVAPEPIGLQVVDDRGNRQDAITVSTNFEPKTD
ncbi:MAG: glycine cleavage system aminomethyltransferase GcvT [Gammaproteobacteria bacterium]|nr:glycine cleavage system aminomethyltransferase GcvT [Gammaproteobacteria bacterium]